MPEALNRVQAHCTYFLEEAFEPELSLRLLQWSIAVVYSINAIFAKPWAVAVVMG